MHAPSTHTSAPTVWAARAIWATGGRVPMRLLAAVTATSRVRGDSSDATASTGSSPVAGSKSAHRTTAPTAAAACTHGRTLAS